MEHPLHSISYVADIDGVLVIMAHIRPCLDPSSPPATEQNESIETAGYIPKMTCHVLDTTDVSLLYCHAGLYFVVVCFFVQVEMVFSLNLSIVCVFSGQTCSNGNRSSFWCSL